MATTLKQHLTTSDVPEVAEFLRVQEQMTALLKEHSDVVRQLREVGVRYNEALTAAHEKIRELGVTCGPFIEAGCSYDAQMLLDELGEKKFLQIGGKVGQKKTAAIDKRTVEKAAGMNEIPKSLFEASRRPRFKKPAVFELPT